MKGIWVIGLPSIYFRFVRYNVIGPAKKHIYWWEAGENMVLKIRKVATRLLAIGKNTTFSFRFRVTSHGSQNNVDII